MRGRNCLTCGNADPENDEVPVESGESGEKAADAEADNIDKKK